jgi:transcriptional regulator with XRE-family HTH domain
LFDASPFAIDVCSLVGRNVRRHRLAAGLSQEDLADAASLDRTYVSGVERGVRNPTVRVLQSLAAALDVKPADLLVDDATGSAGGRRRK